MGPQATRLDVDSAGVDSIETSTLEEFLALKAEWVRCTTYRQRAEELRTSVRAPVYQKVIDDYSHRLVRLDERLAPMLAHIRAEDAKLHALLARLKSAYEEAQLRCEELEFRHAVGELSESDLAEARVQPERAAGEYQRELAAAERLRAQFVSALGEVAGVGEVSAPPDEVSDREVAGKAPSDDPGTNLVDIPSADQTIVLPPAVLVEDGDGRDPVEHRLGGLTLIGRTPDNHIQVAAPNISRRHAVVEIVNAGYRIRDLESQNGTFVNDERIKDHALVDGDRIQIGEVEFVFRSPAVRAHADES